MMDTYLVWSHRYTDDDAPHFGYCAAERCGTSASLLAERFDGPTQTGHTSCHCEVKELVPAVSGRNRYLRLGLRGLP
jgi:hypothetical protein